jgi:hypothetical protein
MSFSRSAQAGMTWPGLRLRQVLTGRLPGRQKRPRRDGAPRGAYRDAFFADPALVEDDYRRMRPQ